MHTPRQLAAGPSTPRAHSSKDDLGVKAVLKALRSEYHQINEMEARIQSQRVKWMHSVETLLDRQEQLAITQAVKAVQMNGLNGNGNHNHLPRLEDDPGPEPSPRTAAANDATALTTFHSTPARPGPRPSPPPMLPELDDGASFDPEFPKAADVSIVKWDGRRDFFFGNPDTQETDFEPEVCDDKGSIHRDSARHSGRKIEIAQSPEAIAEGRRISLEAQKLASPAQRRFDSRRSAHSQPKEIEPEPTNTAFRWLNPVVTHPAFDATCASMILLNSAIIGFNVEWMTTHDEEPAVMVVAGHLCTAFFLVELILRMTLYGRAFFYNENRGWNIFDFLLVFFSFVDLILSEVAQGSGSSVAQNLKTIKMLRIVRVFRVFRFFRELSLLALMIVESLRSLAWALILLMIIIYVFSICFTSMATDYMNLPENEREMSLIPEVQRQFGGLLSTIYTLVLSMLSGVSWGVASDALFSMNLLAGSLFLFYVAFTILAVMNIITGVFVDNAVETARTQREFLIQKEMELKEKYTKEMRALFSEMDQDGSGTISFNEIEKYLVDERIKGYFSALGLDPNDAERLFRLIDDDGSGDVDVGEFLDGCIRLKGQARSIDVYALMRHTHDLEKKLDHLTEFLQCPILVHHQLLPGE